MSPLAMREAQKATEIRCVTAKELQSGELNKILTSRTSKKTNGHGVARQLLNSAISVCVS